MPEHWCLSPPVRGGGSQAWLHNTQTPSYIPVANGGGTENVAVAVALNDMLVQAPNGDFIVLFPVWPADQPAGFTGLLAKGGFEVSASKSAAGVVGHLSVVGLATRKCTIKTPWPTSPPSGTTVRCGSSGAAAVDWSADKVFFSFSAPAGVNCTVSNSGSLTSTPSV